MVECAKTEINYAEINYALLTVKPSANEYHTMVADLIKQRDQTRKKVMQAIVDCANDIELRNLTAILNAQNRRINALEQAIQNQCTPV